MPKCAAQVDFGRYVQWFVVIQRRHSVNYVKLFEMLFQLPLQVFSLIATPVQEQRLLNESAVVLRQHEQSKID